VIEAGGISMIYKSGCGEIRAVDCVDLSIAAGDFVMIFGRSGSGKSTLLGILAGLIRPTAGRVSVKDRDLGSLSDDAISDLRAREIGFVFQFSGLLPTLTLLENVLVPTLFTAGREDSLQTALDLLEKTGLSDRVDAYPCTLSSGEMKRAAIARALINRPSVLIADEPTGDLDADTENEIMCLFRQLNREGMTVVMVTHNPDLTPYSTRAFRMERGRLALEKDRRPVDEEPG
jgi:putative ABC transport system ATP-binding protein